MLCLGHVAPCVAKPHDQAKGSNEVQHDVGSTQFLSKGKWLLELFRAADCVLVKHTGTFLVWHLCDVAPRVPSLPILQRGVTSCYMSRKHAELHRFFFKIHGAVRTNSRKTKSSHFCTCIMLHLVLPSFVRRRLGATVCNMTKVHTCKAPAVFP